MRESGQGRDKTGHVSCGRASIITAAVLLLGSGTLVSIWLSSSATYVSGDYAGVDGEFAFQDSGASSPGPLS